MFKAGRNDPCPCGSQKKYKGCCWAKDSSGKKTFKAKVLSGIKPQKNAEETTEETQAQPKIDLMQRAFGAKIGNSLSPQNDTHQECGEGCSHHH